ncbi:phosphoribosylformylglycinamidine cyclo-ligase [Spirochaetia bacterium 38H-sp]|uniref:Phosphoribosylformylglycinamidine cyclo-ligase n=1 Tax=Rarispira pelagica TaxID=3141764 RepID=A0ABU9UDY2_9SPIR
MKEKKDSLTYKAAGVDIEEGYKTVQSIKKEVESTFDSNVMDGIGSFAGMYALAGYREPVLVSGTDGVGTKLEVEFAMDRYENAGIDCVAMCVNDILCHGAKPLFFLDYLACGKLEAEKAARLVKGIAEGCRQADCSLIGGETAEMPGFYPPGKYDIAGFAVGVVEKSTIINGSNIQEGDLLIGLASSGVHSNGFSLVRKAVTNYEEKYNGHIAGELLVTPTKIYVKPILGLLTKLPGAVKGMAHITGGGFRENIPRMFREDFTAVIKKGSWEILPVFKYLMSKGISEEEMYNTFNMGIGFVLTITPEAKDAVIKYMENIGIKATQIGIIKKGKKGICLE